MTDTATDAAAFTDIVADIVPETHWQCFACYPQDHPKPRGICGVQLLGIDPPPGSEFCKECDDVYADHLAGHLEAGDG